MTVSPEIAAAQAAYAARPFLARASSFNFSGSFRFDSFEEARQYLADQLGRKGAVWDGSSSSRNPGLKMRSCYVEMPDGSTLDLEALDLIEMPQGPGTPKPLIRDQAEVAAEKALANIAREFPDYDPATLPAIPAGWVDSSWHNDACPSFSVGNVQIMIDYETPEVRETPELKRFSAFIMDAEGYTEDFARTDDWDELLAAVAGKMVA